MDTRRRRNARLDTVIVSFAMCAVRPSLQEVEKVILSDMKLDFGLVVGLQLHHTKNIAIIMFKSVDSAKLFVETNNNKHWIRNLHHTYLIPVYLDDDTVEVSVHDIPMSFNNREIINFMKKYGEVVSVRNDTWKKFFKGVCNGVRVLKMHLHKEIPSYVKAEIDGQMYDAFITYKNQTPTCKYCQHTAHNGKTCLEAANLKTQAGENTSTTSSTSATTPTSPASTSATTSSANAETAPIPNQAASTRLIPAYMSQTSPSNQPEQQQQRSETMDCTEVTTVERKKIAANRNRQQAPSSNDDGNSDTQTGKEGAQLDTASPPRKQMITRSNKKNSEPPGTV